MASVLCPIAPYLQVPSPRGHVASKTPLSSIGTHTTKRSQTISAYFLVC